MLSREDLQARATWRSGVLVAVAMICAALLGNLSGCNLRLPRWSNHQDLTRVQWITLAGKWETFGGLQRATQQTGSSNSAAIALAPVALKDGSYEVEILIPSYTQGCRAHLVVRISGIEDRFLSAGLGGDDAAYSIGINHNGVWKSLKDIGEAAALVDNVPYRVQLALSNVTVKLTVNGMELLEYTADEPVVGNQVGFYMEGCEEVNFICPQISG